MYHEQERVEKLHQQVKRNKTIDWSNTERLREPAMSCEKNNVEVADRVLQHKYSLKPRDPVIIDKLDKYRKLVADDPAAKYACSEGSKQNRHTHQKGERKLKQGG